MLRTDTSRTDLGAPVDPLRPVSVLNPQLVLEVRDSQFGTVGYLVIDRTLGNASLGGIRLAPGLTVDELAGLARAMTLKCSFLNTYIGGAKAGITAPQSLLATNRNEVLAAFGHGLEPILSNGIYYAGDDLGTSTADVNVVRQGAGLPAIDPPTDGAYFAAASVAETIKQSLQSRKITVPGATAAIEGFGKVGSNLAMLLARQAVHVVAVSTSEGAIYNPAGLDVRQLISLMKLHGDCLVHEYRDAERITLPDVLLLDVDVLVPCARPQAITSQNAGKVRSRLVIPGANISVTSQAERILFERDILYVPDFLTNGGAVLASSMVARGFRQADVTNVIEREFARKIAKVLEKARARGAMPTEVAEEIAWRNFRQMESELNKRSSSRTGLLKKTLRKGLRGSLQRGASILYSRKLIPSGLVHGLALAELKRGLGAD